MDTDNTEGPLIPAHSKQASRAMLGLFFYSSLMFTLPFGVFFGVQTFIKRYFVVDDFTNTFWSVLSVVLAVNSIIIAYAYKAYHEKEYDDDGNEIIFDEQIEKSDLNLKQD